MGALLFCLFGCSSSKSLHSQEDILKFNQLFQNTFHQSGYLGGIGVGQSSISCALLFGRYTVHLKFDIKKEKGKYVKSSDLRVHISEYTNQLLDGTPTTLGRQVIGKLN